LTPDGLGVLDHANIVIEQVEKLYDRARPEKISGLIRMGVSEAVAMAGLPSIIEIAGRRHPNLRIEMTVGTSGDLERDLLAGRIDLTIGINLHDDPRLRIIALGIQQATWLAKAGTDLPAKIRPRDIGHLPILSNPSPSPMYQQTMNWFRAEGLSPRHISVSNSITIIAHLVAAGIGVAILPTRLVEAQIRAGRVVALKSDPAIDDSRMSAAYRTDDWRPTVNALIEITREVIDGLHWLETSN
jgi:DNA-binding transcriptional LysR family regulator